MKNIFIGIDVSKKTLDATAISTSTEGIRAASLGYRQFENSKRGFRSLASWAGGMAADKSDVLFCCETTGAYDRAMCGYLTEKGFAVWREGALQIKLSSGLRKGKDDRADSEAIARYAMRFQDRMQVYETPDRNIEELRQLLLYRRSTEQDRRSARVRLKELEATAARSRSLTFIIRQTRRLIDRLTAVIEECESRMLELQTQDEALRRSHDHLNSVKGMGIINITAMIVYTNNFRAFRTSRQLASYYGVAAFRRRSGTSVDSREDVRKYSSSMLKSYLTQAAQSTIMPGGIFRPYYERMRAVGKAHGVALNNIKNKLIHLCVALIRDDCDFDPAYLYKRTKSHLQENMMLVKAI